MELTSSRPPHDAAPPSPPTVTTAMPGARAAVGQCSNCHARLAPDQRYCVECGRRTNEARPTLMREPGQQMVRDFGAADASAPAALRTRTAPQGTLIAGIAVLLLAMGVGVLIGHRPAAPVASAPTQVVAAPVAAAASTTPVDAAAVATTPDATTSKAAAKAAKKAAKAAAAAAKAPAVVKPKAGKIVKPGDKGSGPGYDKKTGSFTGDFFGP